MSAGRGVASSEIIKAADQDSVPDRRARVSEFAHIRVEHFFFEELMILIDRGKGGKSRYVPILSELA